MHLRSDFVKPPKYFYFVVRTTEDGFELIDRSDRDVVEVVRWGERKYWEEESTFCLNKEGCYGSETKADWFCADGKRKDGPGDV